MICAHALLYFGLASLAFSSVVSAQDVRLSVKGSVFIGGNLFSVSSINGDLFSLGDSPLKKQTKVGLNAGGAVKLPLSPRWSLQPEIHISREGVVIETTGEPKSTLNLQMFYVDIPLLVRYELGNPVSHVQPFVVAGASGAWRVACTEIVSTAGVGASQECDVAEGDANENSHDFFRKYDARAQFGIGTSIFTNVRETIVQLRYTYGLMNIVNVSGSTSKTSNRSLTFLIGVAM